ncbi:sensor histidine kinase [Novosphingobium panipatense]|uniref:histidine kinase n=1 Tax=Novosphingobium panipatense TaxID=428991 RepID=A0ABY1QIA8_9SPHN|nr:HAMP domain-containing sensor histidine kinase [Novosphingobium panipatense]SMP69934.1 Signal transduction histidine kinase [Novosphingobium panipatense]
MRRLLRSFSFRLALIYAGLFCLSVALLVGTGYWLRVTVPMDEVRGRLEREAEQLQTAYGRGDLPPLAAALERRAARLDGPMAFHALLTPEGRTVAANLPSWPLQPRRDLLFIEADAFADGVEIDHTALVRDIRLPNGARLLVGRDVEELINEGEILRTAAVWILGVTLLLGLGGGWLMSRAIGRRIEALTVTVRQVMEGDLTGRVHVRGTADDFDRLGETLNMMLHRIQTLFQAVQRVSDNAAHELRTPLARLIGRLEALEHLAPDASPARLAAGDAIVEANRLQQILSALMRISRLENGRHPLHLQRTDVVQLLEDLFEFYQPEAERIGTNLIVSARRPLVADLDLDLVFQALSNLLDNALKHAGAGCRVEISAMREAGGLVLSVRDDGPGIADEDAARVTEQFYRAAKASAVPGEGLGLSMVAAIAHAHGATLELVAAQPGLRVSLIIPEHHATGAEQRGTI